MPIPLAAALIASAVIAAGSASATAAVQKKASRENDEYIRRQQSRIDAKAAQENAWYRQEYYQDPLRTQGMVAMLRKMRDYNDRLIARQQNTGLITGATHEQVIATRGAAMQSYANGVAEMKAADDNRKASVATAWQRALDSQFSRQQGLDDARIESRMQSMQNAVDNVNNFSAVAQSYIGRAAGPGNNNYNPEGTLYGDANSNLSQAELAEALYSSDPNKRKKLWS